jgi:hypothetical protein
MLSRRRRPAGSSHLIEAFHAKATYERRLVLHKKSEVSFGYGLDVRRRLCPAVARINELGYALGFLRKS